MIMIVYSKLNTLLNVRIVYSLKMSFYLKKNFGRKRFKKVFKTISMKVKIDPIE